MKVSISLCEEELEKIILTEVKKEVVLKELDWPREWTVKFINEGINGGLKVGVIVEASE